MVALVQRGISTRARLRFDECHAHRGIGHENEGWCPHFAHRMQAIMATRPSTASSAMHSTASPYPFVPPARPLAAFSPLDKIPQHALSSPAHPLDTSLRHPTCPSALGTTLRHGPSPLRHGPQSSPALATRPTYGGKTCISNRVADNPTF